MWRWPPLCDPYMVTPEGAFPLCRSVSFRSPLPPLPAGMIAAMASTVRDHRLRCPWVRPSRNHESHAALCHRQRIDGGRPRHLPLARAAAPPRSQGNWASRAAMACVAVSADGWLGVVSSAERGVKTPSRARRLRCPRRRHHVGRHQSRIRGPALSPEVRSPSAETRVGTVSKRSSQQSRMAPTPASYRISLPEASAISRFSALVGWNWSR